MHQSIDYAVLIYTMIYTTGLKQNRCNASCRGVGGESLSHYRVVPVVVLAVDDDHGFEGVGCNGSTLDDELDVLLDTDLLLQATNGKVR
jgi:hypothetical protein